MTQPSSHWRDDVDPDYDGEPPAKWPRFDNGASPVFIDPTTAPNLTTEEDDWAVVDFGADGNLHSVQASSHELFQQRKSAKLEAELRSIDQEPDQTGMDWIAEGGSHPGGSATSSQILFDQERVEQNLADLQNTIDKARDINAEARQLTASSAETSQGQLFDAHEQTAQPLISRNEKTIDMASQAIQIVRQHTDEVMETDRYGATQF